MSKGLSNFGVIISESPFDVQAASGIATGGDSLSLQDTSRGAADGFDTIGVVTGDLLFMLGPGFQPIRWFVGATITHTSLSFSSLPFQPVSSGVQYMVVRGSANNVLIGGDIDWEYASRLAMLDPATRTGDIYQNLGRHSRVGTMRNGQLKLPQFSVPSIDTFDIDSAHQLRTWAEAGTTVYVTDKLERQLACIVKRAKVKQRAATKGFEVDLELVEANP